MVYVAIGSKDVNSFLVEVLSFVISNFNINTFL